jgi:DNA-binding CsgD family transcriptional regulator
MTYGSGIGRKGRSVSLVGRDADLEVVGSFLEEAAIGGASIVILGDPGVGKSALLDAAAELAEATGAQVLRAEGAEFEADISFSVLNQLLLPLRSNFGVLSSVHRAALETAIGIADGEIPERLVISTATLSLLSQVAASRPLVVIVDDLPWVDRASAGVLGFVARRTRSTQVGFLAAGRTGAHSFFERGDLPEYELEPLGSAAALELIALASPDMADRVRERVLVESGGNPLALIELPSALTEPQRFAKAALPEVLPLTDRLQAIFESRLAPLPSATRAILLLSALEGSGDLRMYEASGGTEAWLDGLEPAERLGLVYLDSTSHRLAFRHPLIRSAIVELATASERRQAHLALSEIYSNEPERAVWHLAQATVTPDREIASRLEEAAHMVLRRGDGVAAIATLTRAADLSPDDADRTRRLTEAAFIGSAITGDLETAARMLGQAHPGGVTPDESLISALTAASVILHADGDIDTGHRLISAAIQRRMDENSAIDPLLEVALDNLRVICQYGGRKELWDKFYAVVDQLAPVARSIQKFDVEAGDDPARVTDAALHHLDSCIEALQTEQDPLVHIRVATHAFYVDRLRVCRQPLRRLIRQGEQGIANMPGSVAQILLGFERFWAGDWTDAVVLSEEGAKSAEGQGFRVMSWPGWYCRALIAAGQGHDDLMWSLTDKMAGSAVPRGALMVENWCRHVGSLAALGRLDFEGAYLQASAISPPGEFAPMVPVALWVALDLVEAAVRTHRTIDAEAHVTALTSCGVERLSPRMHMTVLAAQALVADDDRSADLFAAALATPGAAHWPFELARVELLFGERLRRSRATAESRSHIMSALETFERLRAGPWAERARRELRASGRVETRTTPASVSSLTPQEREIASLAAAGYTNKEIGNRLYLSHRTVGAHLYRIFPKLGITSRAALRDALDFESS